MAHRAPKHDHLALGEINDGGGVVNNAEAQGDERVDRPIGQAGNEILEQRRFQEVSKGQLSCGQWPAAGSCS
jgi:hypothetical protein